MYLSRIYESDPAYGVCSDAIWESLYEGACAVIINIKISVAQGVNFKIGNFKIFCSHDGRWQIAERTELCEQ